MSAPSTETRPQIIGWHCEGTFPALFTDSVSIAKRWMESGQKVSAMVRASSAFRAITAEDAELVDRRPLVVGWASPATTAARRDEQTDRDAAFEAVRKRLCALPRYSFWIGDHGGVKRVEDRSGAWIDFDAAHELFDPVSVDAAIAAQQGKGGE
ncbi:hypothetical protein [Achromobacter insolitus]|uniref:hypothetical protein n=1 Tax=Achromobacter insolitus TaxID=217204 RepID=UPI001CBBD749|nr:hypothetical protein [Achromobacter insolitus]